MKLTQEDKVILWAYIGVLYGLIVGKLFSFSWLLILASSGVLTIGFFIIRMAGSWKLKTKKQPPRCPQCKTKMWYSDEGAWICGNCNYMRTPGTGGNESEKKRR